ncbi:neurogenic locus notch-like protein isoform X2 [Wolffia australiana]
MGTRREILLMLAIPLLAQIAAAASPVTQSADSILPSLPNGTCAEGQCGMGTCKARGSLLGFSCECNPGWTKLDPSGLFPFLPCLIPNCTVNYSCSNATGSPSPPPQPPPPPPQVPTNPLSPLFNSCDWSYCGEGDCVSTSFLTFRCDCRRGYSNLLNSTVLPCVQECFLGANCPSLLPSPAPPPLVNVTNGAAAPSFPRGVAWMFLFCSWIFVFSFSR